MTKFSRVIRRSTDKASGAQIFTSPLRNPQSSFSLGLKDQPERLQVQVELESVIVIVVVVDTHPQLLVIVEEGSKEDCFTLTYIIGVLVI